MKRENYSTVDVKVGEFMRGWVMSTCKTDVIRLDKYSVLWGIVKQNLVLEPDHWKPEEDRSGTISIVLTSENSRPRVYDPSRDRTLRLNTLYRCYVNDEGSERIKRYLEREFKNAFHVYMVGALGNNSEMNILEGITQFLMDYNLSEFIDKKMLAKLMKDWYRYRVANPETYGIPIFF